MIRAWFVQLKGYLAGLTLLQQIAVGAGVVAAAFFVGWGASRYIKDNAPRDPNRPYSPRGQWATFRPSDFFEKSCDKRIAMVEDDFLGHRSIGLTRHDVADTAKKLELPSRLFAAVIYNEISDFDWGDEVQQHIQSRGSSGIVQLQPSRVVKHNLYSLTEQELEQRLRNAESKGEKFDLEEYAYRRLTSDHKIALSIAANEIRRIVIFLNASLDMTNLPTGKKGPCEFTSWFLSDSISWDAPYANIKSLSEIRQMAADQNVNIDLAFWSNIPESARKEAILAFVISALYNHNLDTDGGMITSWRNSRDGCPFDNILPPGAQKSLRPEFRQQHRYWRSLVHGFNAAKLWSVCLSETNWPTGAAQSQFVWEFVGTQTGNVKTDDTAITVRNGELSARGRGKELNFSWTTNLPQTVRPGETIFLRLGANYRGRPWDTKYNGDKVISGRNYVFTAGMPDGKGVGLLPITPYRRSGGYGFADQVQLVENATAEIQFPTSRNKEFKIGVHCGLDDFAFDGNDRFARRGYHKPLMFYRYRSVPVGQR